MSAAPSDWTEILVGHQKPRGLSVVSSAAANRTKTAAANHHFADLLQQQNFTSLLNQQGITADDIREAHDKGAKYHRQIGDTNATIAAAYQFSHESGTELQRELTTIAHDGNSRINEIQTSKDPMPVKVSKITDVVVDCQTQANVKAAAHCDNVFNQIQNVLDKRGIPTSAREFAKNHGIDTTRMFGSPTREAISQQVETTLNRSNLPATTKPATNIVKPEGGPAPATHNPNATNLGAAPPAAPPPAEHAAPPQSSPSNLASAPPSAPPANGQVGTPRSAPANLGPAPPPPAAAPTVPGASVPRPVSPSIPGSGATPPISTPPISTPHLPAAPSAPPISTAGAPPLSPTNLVQNFDQGLHMGTPMSAAANAVLPAAPVSPQMPQPVAEVGPAAPPTFATSGQTPVFDTAHVPAADVAPPPPPVHVPNETGATYLAGPAAAPATPAAAAPAGPLPAYGADIRPPVAAAPASPAPPTAPAGPATAAPSSGPVNPSAGAGGVSQAAVVRQPSTHPSSSPTLAGVGEQAVLTTAGGGAAGAASAAATARGRLQRLVDAVARQEPRLRWAAGDRADGTTVLVTDLASGWIPPDIDIPTGMELLEPAHRRGDLERLLGEVTVTAGYTPIHYLPPAEKQELVPTSPRVRQGPVVEELGWELGQATKWRDGLPRLAHTLARAASAGTGVVDNEVELLREELAKVRDQVLEVYPDNVDVAMVENWQLLAAIDALVTADKIAANYHFAWFQALSRTTTGGAV